MDTKTKEKAFQFVLTSPIILTLNENIRNLFKENNCNDMIPSIQMKTLNLMFLRKSETYEKAVDSAKKDVKKILEQLGFIDIKLSVINYTAN